MSSRWPRSMRGDWSRWPTAKLCRTRGTKRLRFFEVVREAVRFRRPGRAQPARIGAAQFADYSRDRSRRRFAGGDAFVGDWITAAGFETAEKLRVIRYR